MGFIRGAFYISDHFQALCVYKNHLKTLVRKGELKNPFCDREKANQVSCS